jgi:hypothetical protein
MAHVEFPANAFNSLTIAHDDDFNITDYLSVVWRMKSYAATNPASGDYDIAWRSLSISVGHINAEGEARINATSYGAANFDPYIDHTVWRWYAVTFDTATGPNVIKRLWVADGSITDWPEDDDWVFLDDVQAVSGSLPSLESPLYLGNPFHEGFAPHRFDLSHFAWIAGNGAGGLPGGTPVFQLDPDNIPENTASAFTSTSGHTVTVQRTGSPSTTLVPDPPDASASVAISSTSDPGEDATGQVTIDDDAEPGAVIIPWEGIQSDRGMPAVKVEAAIGQPYCTPIEDLVWTRIDEVCCVREITTVEGRDSKVDSIEPGECTIVLDNRSGALDPSNDQSPWWSNGAPGIDYGTRVRVTAYETAADLATDTDGHVLFAGYVDRIIPRWELDDATVTLELVDALAALASHIVTERLTLDDLLADPAVTHVWPLDTPGSTVVAAKGGTDGTWSSPRDVGEPILPYDTTPATLITPGTARAEIIVDKLSTTRPWVVAVWVKLDPDTTTNDAVVMQLTHTTNTSHSLQVRVNMPAGTLELTGRLATPDDTTSVVVDGNLHLVRLRYNPSLSQYDLMVDDSFAEASITTSPNALDIDTIRIGSTTNAARGSYSYAVLTDETFGAGYLLSNWWEWVHTPWDGDTTADRFERVCRVAGTGGIVDGSGFPDVAPATSVAGQNGLEHIGRCANGDGATVTVDHDSDGVPLYRLVNYDAPIVWFDTRGQVAAPVLDVAPVYGIDRLVRRVDIHRPAGAGAIETVSVRSTKPYPTAQALGLDTELAEASDARARAVALRDEREVPRMLIPTLTIAGRDVRVPWAALWLRPGDLAGIIAHPPGRSEFVQASVVERVEHTIDYQRKQWTVMYGLDRVAQWIDWQDVIDGFDDWDEVLSTFATWGDLLASGAPNPPST